MPQTKQLSIEKQVLSNQAALLFKRHEDAPRLALSIYIPGGNLADPIPGLIDIVDRLLMKGTDSRSQEEIAAFIDGLTLEVDTDTKRDYSIISATLLEEDLDASLAFISDLFYHSTLADFDREKAKLAGEIQMDLDPPKHKASDQFVRAIFENTPYGYVNSLILDYLPNMNSLEQAKHLYRRLYQPSRLVFSIAGNISQELAVRKIEEYFPETPQTEALPDFSHQPVLAGMKLESEQYIAFPHEDSNQAHIFKGWLAPSIQHPDYLSLVVMNTIFGGGGLSNRLFVELRDKQGLAYNVRSSYDAYRHRGLFSIYIGTEPANREKCLQGFITESQKLMDTPVSAVELEDAKRNLLGRRSVYLETALQQACYIGTNYILGRPLEEIECFYERVQAISADDIQRVAQTYLSQPALVSIVAPPEHLQ